MGQNQPEDQKEVASDSIHSGSYEEPGINGFPYPPKVVEKDWGRELIIRNNARYCGKILEYQPDWFNSTHHHLEKEETFYVMNGRFLITVWMPDGSKRRHDLNAGACIHIPRGWPHKVLCVERGAIFEASSPHSDDDVFRTERSYSL